MYTNQAENSSSIIKITLLLIIVAIIGFIVFNTKKNSTNEEFPIFENETDCKLILKDLYVKHSKLCKTEPTFEFDYMCEINLNNSKEWLKYIKCAYENSLCDGDQVEEKCGSAPNLSRAVSINLLERKLLEKGVGRAVGVAKKQS